MKKKIYFFILNIIYYLLFIINKQNKLVFIYAENSNSFMNIPVFHEYLIKKNIRTIKISYNENFLSSIIKLSKAKIIFLDQTNYLISHIKLHTSQIVMQLWHGGGEYKAVGFDAYRKNISPQEEYKRISRLHGKYSYFLCSDTKLITKYAHMFNLNINSILAFGSPRMDLFYKVDKKKSRQIFCEKFDISINSIIVLYCPTFRKNYDLNKFVLNDQQKQDIEKNINNIKIFTKKHPNEGTNSFEFISYIELLSVCDILISDYSSIIFDFSFFKKPIILYTPDLEQYQKLERKLYFQPNEIVNPLMVAYNYNDLLNCLKHPVLSNIWNNFMSANDGKSCEKLFNFICHKNIF